MSGTGSRNRRHLNNSHLHPKGSATSTGMVGSRMKQTSGRTSFSDRARGYLTTEPTPRSAWLGMATRHGNIHFFRGTEHGSRRAVTLSKRAVLRPTARFNSFCSANSTGRKGNRPTNQAGGGWLGLPSSYIYLTKVGKLLVRKEGGSCLPPSWCCILPLTSTAGEELLSSATSCFTPRDIILY
jgi:hypothetical protein